MEQVSVLWLTAGLSCDGDSIAMTAATQPSLEDLVLGAFPGVPRVRFHHPVLAYEVGDEFLAGFEARGRGQARPLHPRRRGLHPRRDGQRGGVLGRLRHRPRHRPAHPHHHLGRPAHGPGVGGDGGGHVRRLRRDPRHGRQPHRRHGPGRLPGLGLALPERAAHRQPARLPHPARQLHRDPALPAPPAGGDGPHDPPRPRAPAQVAVRPDPARELRPGRLLRAGRLRRRVRVEQVHRQAGLLGAGGRLQRGQAGLDERRRRLRQRRRHLHRLHHARLPRQVPTVPRRAAGGQDVVVRGPALRALGAGPAQRHPGVDERGAGVAGSPSKRTAAQGTPAAGRATPAPEG